MKSTAAGQGRGAPGGGERAPPAEVGGRQPGCVAAGMPRCRQGRQRGWGAPDGGQGAAAETRGRPWGARRGRCCRRRAPPPAGAGALQAESRGRL
jgi:hypothetical protein